MKLGSRQLSCLRSLRDHGGWDDSGRCGWVWDNRSGTTRIMESLVKRGLADRFGGIHVYYTITQAGKELLREKGYEEEN